MNEIITSVFLVMGALFTLVAAVGVYRLPDILMKMHASTKAGTLGAGLILVALMITFDDIGVVTRALATIIFLVLTAPIAAHLIGRAAYVSGVKFWKGTIIDEMQDLYEKKPDEKSAGGGS
ncbi:MAG: monovalent cation/H(+) antiporter subunit G [Rhodothermaceae bacterium]|nr:monovalent cation/H(+) antiporter subunit G [Rhodothermaceae bacterium]